MSSTFSPMVQPVSAPEAQPLLRSQLPELSLRKRLGHACTFPKHLCPPSRAAALILVWSAIVGTTYTLAIYSSVAVGVVGKKTIIHGPKHHLSIFISVLVPYACLALVLLIYPLSGFVADIYCGRYKTVIGSLSVLVCSVASFTAGCVIAMFSIGHGRKDFPVHVYDFGKYLLVIVAIVAFVLFIVGLSGFQANFIQLGLDQLHDAPSEYLGLFVHWAIWAGSVTIPVVQIMFASYACSSSKELLYGLFSLPPLCFVVLSLVLAFSCRKKQWFYSEPGQHNPYKMVIKVLNFSRKHKFPLRRSAFTYDGNERPTRLDFSKERYGGPFTTEQVEDVKSFLRILVVLVALGPIFLLDVPVSYFIFPAFTLHTGYGSEFKTKNCTARWLVLESGTLGQLLSVIIFPIYIWLTYSVLWKCVPRIFSRLLLGNCLLFLGVLSIFATDLTGHLTLNVNDPDIPKYYNGNTSYCMFESDFKHIKALRLHWGFHILPNLFIGFSPMLIMATALEFISAQSPHSMKGLLVGVFFAIKGLFQLSSAILLLPFSLPEVWSEGEFISSPRAMNCGFGYFLITCGLALIGIILFSAVAKRYQYRERDDPPYDQAVVEEVFARNVRQNTYQVYSPEDPPIAMYSDNNVVNVGLQ